MKALNLGEILLTKRRELGLTQEDLASHMGVTKASVSKWETGQSYPDITLLPVLASYFDMGIDALLQYEPNLTMEEVQKRYLEYAKAFAQTDFMEVYGTIKAALKKYYSCYPFVFYMGALLLNHYPLAPADEKKPLMEYMLSLFVRIQTNCKDAIWCERARQMEATCHLMNQEPEKVIALLSHAMEPVSNEVSLLAMAYTMKGESALSEQALQVGSYQNLLCLMQNLMGMLTPATSEAQFDAVKEKLIGLTKLFHLKKLHPGTCLQLYLLLAQTAAGLQRTEEALATLEEYVTYCNSDLFPLKLHGDDFFNRINSWLEDLDLGLNPPRSDEVIRQSMIDSVIHNPYFALLSHEPRYKLLVKQLQKED